MSDLEAKRVIGMGWANLFIGTGIVVLLLGAIGIIGNALINSLPNLP